MTKTLAERFFLKDHLASEFVCHESISPGLEFRKKIIGLDFCVQACLKA